MNNGRKWRIVVYEACQAGELPIIDTRLVSKEMGNTKCNGFERPVRTYELLIDALEQDELFDKDVLYFYPASKGFSMRALGEGLRKIGRFLNEPLVYKNEKDIVDNSNTKLSRTNTNTSE